MRVNYDARLNWLMVVSQTLIAVSLQLIFPGTPIWVSVIRTTSVLFVLWFVGELHYRVQGGN